MTKGQFKDFVLLVIVILIIVFIVFPGWLDLFIDYNNSDNLITDSLLVMIIVLQCYNIEKNKHKT